MLIVHSDLFSSIIVIASVLARCLLAETRGNLVNDATMAIFTRDCRVARLGSLLAMTMIN
jgi:hypothetical protein